jgi:hypothetical protein
MAERSKAPDSRFAFITLMMIEFWSSKEGVGSNPTPDNKVLFVFRSETILDGAVFTGLSVLDSHNIAILRAGFEPATYGFRRLFIELLPLQSTALPTELSKVMNPKALQI